MTARARLKRCRRVPLRLNCSPPLSQTVSRLRPRSGRRCGVGGLIIGDIKGMLLATDIGKQTFDVGKAGEIAQRISPSPGSAASSVTSAHDVTRLGSRPNPRLGLLF